MKTGVEEGPESFSEDLLAAFQVFTLYEQIFFCKISMTVLNFFS